MVVFLFIYIGFFVCFWGVGRLFDFGFFWGEVGGFCCCSCCLGFLFVLVCFFFLFGVDGRVAVGVGRQRNYHHIFCHYVLTC